MKPITMTFCGEECTLVLRSDGEFVFNHDLNSWIADVDASELFERVGTVSYGLINDQPIFRLAGKAAQLRKGIASLLSKAGS